MTGGRGLRREPHPQDRNEEKEPCACGFTRQDVRHRNLQKARVRGIRRRKKTKSSSHRIEQRAQQPGWTDAYAVPVIGNLMRALPEKGRWIETDAGNNVAGSNVTKGV